MRSYELVLVVEAADEEAIQALHERVTGLITTGGGTVENVDAWGKRRLAYPINDLNEGHYTVFSFKGEPTVAAELDRILKITDGILRHLIVRLDEE